MGKTDPYIFPVYENILTTVSAEKKIFKNVCLLGFTKHNNFTQRIASENFDFYDISLKNWNINNSEWKIDKKYDLVVCTRCAYFCKDVQLFFKKAHNILLDKGILLVDWGLGDHWRYPNFKVGWLKDGEHESFYEKDNYLWSTIWNEKLNNHYNFNLFANRVKKFGYDDVEKSIYKEVPYVYDVSLELDRYNFAIDVQTFWEDMPQLYIIFCGIKK